MDSNAIPLFSPMGKTFSFDTEQKRNEWLEMNGYGTPSTCIANVLIYEEDGKYNVDCKRDSFYDTNT